MYHSLQDATKNTQQPLLEDLLPAVSNVHQLIIDGSKTFILLGNQEATLYCYMAMCFSFASIGTSVHHGGEKVIALLWLLLTGGRD